MGLAPSKDGSTSPMIAVRSAGLSFDSIIGYQASDGRLISLVDERYLVTLLRIANQRFQTNTERIGRFRDQLNKAMGVRGK
jgi:tRNA wybutosine-synthesizing protein 3